MNFPANVRIGVILAAVLSLWGAIEYFRFESSFQAQGRDPYQIAAQDTRLEGVRAAVPESAVLGYLTDLEPGSVTATAMFYSAQFNLAPRLLEQGAAQQQVLGNFARPADFAGLGRRHGLRVERDFQNGVILFRKDH